VERAFGRVGWRDDIILFDYFYQKVTCGSQPAMSPQADIRIEAYQISKSNFFLLFGKQDSGLDEGMQVEVIEKWLSCRNSVG